MWLAFHWQGARLKLTFRILFGDQNRYFQDLCKFTHRLTSYLPKFLLIKYVESRLTFAIWSNLFTVETISPYPCMADSID